MATTTPAQLNTPTVGLMATDTILVHPQGKTRRSAPPPAPPDRLSAREREKLVNHAGADGVIAFESRRRRLQSEADRRMHEALEKAASIPIQEQRVYFEKICNAYEGLDLSGDLDLVREILQYGKDPNDFYAPKQFKRFCDLLQKISERGVVKPQGFFENVSEFAKKTYDELMNTARARSDAVRDKFSAIAKSMRLSEDAMKRFDTVLEKYNNVKDWWADNGPYVKLMVYVPVAATLLWYSHGDTVHTTMYSLLFTALLGPEVITILTRIIPKLWAQPTTTDEPDETSNRSGIAALTSDQDSGAQKSPNLNPPSLIDRITQVLRPTPFVDVHEEKVEDDKPRKVQPQGSNILDSIYQVACDLLGLSVTPSTPSAQVAEAVKLLNLANSASTFISRFYGLIESVLFWITSGLTKVAMKIPILKEYVMGDADATMAERIINNPVSTKSFDRTFAIEALGWHEALITRSGRLRSAGDARYATCLMDYHRICYPQITAYRRQLSTPTTRTEPVVIHLMGPPGIGKSSIIHAILATIYPEAYGRAYNAAETYIISSNPEYPYHDGYIAQPVILAEERFSSTDSPSVTKAIDWLLHIVSGNPMPADQAALEMKGMVYFMPDLIFLTDNVINTSTAAKSNVSALQRRVHIPVEVCPKQRIQLEGSPTDAINSIHAYTFRTLEMTVQGTRLSYARTADPDLDFASMCSLVKKHLKRNHDKHDTLSATIDVMAKQAYDTWAAVQTAPIVPPKVAAQGVIVKTDKAKSLFTPEIQDDVAVKWLIRKAEEDDHDLVVMDYHLFAATGALALQALGRDKNISLDAYQLNGMFNCAIRDVNYRMELNNILGIKPTYTAAVGKRLASFRDYLISCGLRIRSVALTIWDSCIMPILPYLKLLGITVGAAVVGWGIGTLLNHLLGPSYHLELDVQEQGYAGKDAAAPRRRAFVSPLSVFGKQVTTSNVVLKPQGAGKPLSDERAQLAIKSFFPNMITVTVFAEIVPGTKVTTSSQMLILDDTTIIGPSHIFDVALAPQCRETAYLEYMCGPMSTIKNVLPLNVANVSMYVPNKDVDRIVLKLAIPLAHMRKVTQHFVPQAYLGKIDRGAATLLKRMDGVAVLAPALNVRVASVTTELPNAIGFIETANALRYDATTFGGDCGSLLLSHDPAAPGLAFGTHIAGDSLSTGYSAPLSREDAEFLCSLDRPSRSWPSPGEIPSERLPYTPLDSQEMKVLPQCVQGLPILGKVKPGRAMYSPEKSALRPSVIAAEFGGDSVPARLGTFELEGKMTRFWEASIGVYRQKEVVHNYDPRAYAGFPIVDEAYLTTPVDVTPLSLHETLNGNKYLPPMETTTSNGDYRIPEGKPKSEYLTRPDPQGPLVASDELKADVEALEQRLRSDVNDAPLITALAKDELRPSAKVALGQTRLIYPYSLDFTVLTRRFFGSFAAHALSRLGATPVYLGISPEQWFLYANQYVKEGIDREDDDGAKYDINIQTRSALSTIDYVLHWFKAQGADPSDQVVRFKILWNIFFPMISFHGFVFLLNLFTSGNALTAFLNCFRHLLAKSAAFAHFAPPTIEPTLANFQHYWRPAIYADDGMQAKDLHFCSSAELQAYIREVFGDTHRSDKNEAEGFGPVFLKRGINVQPPFLFAPLKIESIRNNLRWVRQGLDPADATRQNAETALREFVHFGQPMFEEMKTLINRALVKHSIPPLHMEWITEAVKYIRGARLVSALPHVKSAPSPDVNHSIAQCSLAVRSRDRCPATLSNPKLGATWLADTLLFATASTDNSLPPALAPATPAISQVSLVTQQVTSPTEVISEPVTFNPAAANPFPPTGLEEVLSRQYEVATISWPSASAADVVLATVPFPEAFLAFPQFTNRITGYTLYRADVKINVRVTAPFGSMGVALLSWLPCAGISNQRTLTTRAQSSAESITLSASQNENIVVTYRWSAPVQFGTVAVMGTTEIAALGELKISVLHPLEVVSEAPPSNATISVLASLENVVVTGYDPTTAPPPLAAVRSMREAQPKGVVAQGKTKIEKTDSQAIQVVEAKQEAKSGVLSTITDTVGRTAPLFTAIPGVGGLATAVGMGANLLTPILRTFGLARPDSMETVGRICEDEYRSEAAPVTGQFNAPKLAGSQSAYLHTTQGIIGHGEIDSSVLDICRIPGLLDRQTFTSASSVGTLLASYAVHPCDVKITPVAGNDVYDWIPVNFARGYAYWRGSIDYAFNFRTSVTTNARFRIGFFFNSTAPATIASYAGDFPSVNVDVRGDVTTTVRVPYLNQETYSRTCDFDATDLTLSVPNAEVPCVIGIYLLSPVTAQVITSAPKIYLDIWVAAGPDFQLAHPIGYLANLLISAPPPPAKDPTSLGTSSPNPSFFRALPQGVTRTLFTKITSDLSAHQVAIEAGLVTSEELVGTNQLIRRFRDHTGVSNTNAILDFCIPRRVWYTGSNPAILQGIAHYATAFLGYRGGVRFLAGKEEAAVVCQIGDNNAFGTVIPSTYGVTIPYLDRANYIPTWFGTVWATQSSGDWPWPEVRANLPLGGYPMLAAADDGVLATYLPPPPIYRPAAAVRSAIAKAAGPQRAPRLGVAQKLCPPTKALAQGPPKL